MGPLDKGVSVNIDRRDFTIGAGSALAMSTVSGAVPAAQLKAADGINERRDMAIDPLSLLITGAGSGFGRDLSLKLAARGHRVIATVELPAQVTQLRQAAQTLGIELQVEKIDILNERDRHRIASFEVDVLINNAGIGESGAVVDIPVDVIRSQFETNVFSAFDLTQKFAKKLISEKRRGKIIFISSVVGIFSQQYAGAYSGSKHAIEALAQALQQELKSHGIQVQCINPGPHATGFNDRMMESYKSWFDPAGAVIDHRPLAVDFKQFDPQTAIGPMIEIIESKGGNFRNVVPESFVAATKSLQAKVWDLKV